MNENELNRVLHTWKVVAERPLSFPHDVWQRIEAAGSTSPVDATWLESFLKWLARPLPAATAWSLAFALGLIAGGMTGGSPQPVNPAASYAHSISPLAKDSAP